MCVCSLVFIVGGCVSVLPRRVLPKGECCCWGEAHAMLWGPHCVWAQSIGHRIWSPIGSDWDHICVSVCVSVWVHVQSEEDCRHSCVSCVVCVVGLKRLGVQDIFELPPGGGLEGPGWEGRHLDLAEECEEEHCLSCCAFTAFLSPGRCLLLAVLLRPDILSLPFLDLPLPFLVHPLPFLDLSLPFFGLPLPFLDLSLTVLHLPLPFLDHSLPFLDLSLPFFGLPLPFLDLSLTFLHLPLPFLDHSLPFLGLSLPFLDLPLPFLDLSLPFLDLPLPFIRYLQLAREHPPPYRPRSGIIKAHLFKLLYTALAADGRWALKNSETFTSRLSGP